MPHNHNFTMTTTPDPKIHCLFETGTDVRFNYERYEKEEDEVDSILTEKCQLYDIDTSMTITTVYQTAEEEEESPKTETYRFPYRVWGSIEILDINTNIEKEAFDQNNYGGVQFNIYIRCRGIESNYDPCGELKEERIGGAKAVYHYSSGGWDYPTINSTSFTISNADTGETVAEGGADEKTTGKVCKLQPEQSIDINTIVPLLSGIEVKGSVEFPSMPENCIEIWRYIQGVPPTRMKVKQLCSEEGCPPPKYTVDCEPCCPPGLIEVECGDSICCYNKQGEAVKQCP